MRSYQSHLQSLEKKSPIFRASSLFPALQSPKVSTRFLFLGYWLLKRHIRELSLVISLRSKEGMLLQRVTKTINQAKAYSIELKELLSEDHFFEGSVELEFFSSEPLVFPYPAVTINYYGQDFSTVVHTAERVYNNFEDLEQNSASRAPESGFNVLADQEFEPFLTFVNGPETCKNFSMEMIFYNAEGKTLHETFTTQELAPYATHILYPARNSALEAHLQGKMGAGKLSFHLPWTYPRLIVGNRHKKSGAMSITHSYYDCQKVVDESNYWFLPGKEWHAATLMLPLHGSTKTTFYPIYAPSDFWIDVEFYSKEGELLKKEVEALHLTSPSHEFKQLSYDNPSNAAAVRLIAKTSNSKKIPSRIKLGIDVKQHNIASNICTNLQPFIASWDQKPGTFKWCPMLYHPRGKAWITLVNSSQHVNYTRNADIEVTFFRERDTETIKKQITLPPHGSIQLHRHELQDFLGTEIGWMTATSTNPHILTYYFVETDEGNIGGDHGF